MAPESHFDSHLSSDEILRSGDLTRSVHLRRLEAAVRARCGIEALAVASGTLALWAAFSVMYEIRRGPIVVPAFGFPATARMAAAAGADLIVVDSAVDSPMIDIEQALAVTDSSTCAIAVTDYLDSVADCPAIRSGIPEGVFILEDAAGSFLAEEDGRVAGNGGDIAAISLHASKIVAASEGGLLLTEDAELLDRLRVLRSNGLLETVGYSVSTHVGLNMMLPEVSAAIAVASLSSVETRVNIRRTIRAAYSSFLQTLIDAGVVSRLQADSDPQRFGPVSILVENRAEILRVLRLNGIEARSCWTPLVHEDKLLASRVRNMGDFPHATRWRNHLINLPVHEAMTESDVEYVCEAVRVGTMAFSRRGLS